MLNSITSTDFSHKYLVGADKPRAPISQLNTSNKLVIRIVLALTRAYTRTAEINFCNAV